jgi:hypothetical protein
MVSSGLRGLNQDTYSVASSIDSRVIHERRWITTVLYRPLLVSVRA